MAKHNAIVKKLSSAKEEPTPLEKEIGRIGRSPSSDAEEIHMIRKLKSGEYRLYSRKADPKNGRRRNLGTFTTRGAAEKHERAVQFFKHG